MRRILLALLCTLMMAGCVRVTGPQGASTPEEAVRQSAALRGAAGDNMLNLRILGSRAWQRGMVVLYSGWQPPAGETPGLQMFGYQIVERTTMGGWFATGGGAGGRSDLPPADQVIDYGQGSGSSSNRGSETVVYGRTLAPEVASVRVTFADGQVLGDRAGDGIFAVIRPELATACKLEALDEGGQVLRSVDIGPHAAPGKTLPPGRTPCPGS